MKKRNPYKFYSLLLISCLGLVIILFNCNGKTKPPPPPPPAVYWNNNTPKVNGDSAYAFVKKQVDFGPRVPNSEPHVKCGDYFLEQFKAYGWEVKAQSFKAMRFDDVELDSRNIIASYKAPKATRTILLAAHWDARYVADKDSVDTKKPIDGANDGASGVAVLMELARTISQAKVKPNINIDIVLFDSEDQGYPNFIKEQTKQDTWCLGSQHWAKNNDTNYWYGILLDMVGAKGAKFYKEGYSIRTAGEVVKDLWQVASKIGTNGYFVALDAPEIVDDHVYVNKSKSVPMVDIIEFDPNDPATYFAKYHHTHKDNMDIIDKETLKAVGQTVLQYVYNTFGSQEQADAFQKAAQEKAKPAK
ncbi:hypothetical protein BKI52_34180 [marine bacterium AO1-C]|nr:hypothetical protein BKI52_34180 [marine bacterium AO1-C]